MPSSPSLVRVVLAALLTVLLAIAPTLVSSPSSPHTAAFAQPPAPSEPTGAAPVELELESLDPTSLAPGGTVTARIRVTNTSSQTLEDTTAELRTRTARVTDRTAIAQWQADEVPDADGPPIASSSAHDRLAPGQSTTLSVEASADELGYAEAPYFWGTRRISLTVVSDGDPHAAIRTFVVWRPPGAEATLTQSVLLPVADPDPATAATAPSAHRESLASGRMASTQQLALREEVDWWLDPALMDPPQLPVAEDDEDPAEAEEPPEPSDGAPDLESARYEAAPEATEFATALDEGAGERTVLAMPYAQSDLMALQAAGTGSLTAAVLRSGEDTWAETQLSPHGTAVPVAGEEVDAAALAAVEGSGADVALVPSSSLRPAPNGTVTPSSVGVYEPSEGADASPLMLLAPDPELSAGFSQLTGETDSVQTRQRLLADTATIASEFTTAPRHVLIAPDPEVALDPVAAGGVLDAFTQAPWIEAGRTADLLDAAEQERWTTDVAEDESGGEGETEGDELYALGELSESDIVASAPDEVGHWDHLPEAEEPDLTSPAVLEDLESTWLELDTLAAAMDDDAVLDSSRLLVLDGTATRFRGAPEGVSERADEVRPIPQEMKEQIEIVPASGYNLISDSAGVPVTVTNGLDTPITVRTAVSSDRPLVRIGEEPEVTVPPRGQVEITVPVEAIANGTVTLTWTLTTGDGRVLSEPVEAPLTVNPAWENWTTLLLVIAMGLLVVVGVARAPRTKSTTRAPAMRGPEDPVVLARTGRSQPDTSTTVAPDASGRSARPGASESEEDRS